MFCLYTSPFNLSTSEIKAPCLPLGEFCIVSLLPKGSSDHTKALCTFYLLDRKEAHVVNSCHANLKRIHLCAHTQTPIHAKVGGLFTLWVSLLRVWLSLVAGDSSGTCGDPGTPAHASREAGNFKVRSKVRFTCAVGHTLYGSAERICFPNGTWSGKQPFCKRKETL